MYHVSVVARVARVARACRSLTLTFDSILTLLYEAHLTSVTLTAYNSRTTTTQVVRYDYGVRVHCTDLQTQFKFRLESSATLTL